MNKELNYWLFHDSFSIVEAACLIIGITPNDDMENSKELDVVLSGLKKAVISKTLNVYIRYPDATIDAWYEDLPEDKQSKGIANAL